MLLVATNVAYEGVCIFLKAGRTEGGVFGRGDLLVHFSSILAVSED